MKFNINLDWAVITSIFTLFLFWCGYWYFAGFASFYNYKIDAFDLPLAPLIITGLTIGVDYVIYLILTLILLSFLLSVDKNNWSYIFAKTLQILLNIYLLFYYLYKHFFKSNAPGLIKRTSIRVLIFIKPYLRNSVRLDILLGLKVQRFFNKHKISNKHLKKTIYGDPPVTPTVQFEFAMVIHYLLIILLTLGLATLFLIGKKQSEIGYSAAEKQFQSFSEMPKVQTDTKSKTDLRSTELCFKGLCLITDKDKNVQTYEMKEVKTLHTSDNKKAP